MPRALASRTIRTEPAVLRWARCSRPPGSSARARFLATMTSSAAAGTPDSPNSAATNPWSIPPPPQRCRHSQCTTTAMWRARQDPLAGGVQRGGTGWYGQSLTDLRDLSVLDQDVGRAVDPARVNDAALVDNDGHFAPDKR